MGNPNPIRPTKKYMLIERAKVFGTVIFYSFQVLYFQSLYFKGKGSKISPLEHAHENFRPFRVALVYGPLRKKWHIPIDSHP